MDLQELKTDIEQRKANLPLLFQKPTQTNMRSGMKGRIERQNKDIYNKEIKSQHKLYSEKLSEIDRAMNIEKLSSFGIPKEDSIKDIKLNKPQFKPIRKSLRKEGVDWLYK